MTRHDLEELQQIRHYPCLTITLPTHRTFPDNTQDPIRVKNLVGDAEKRLLQEFSKRDLSPLFKRLEELADHIDYKYALDGLVLAVNEDMARQFVLPFRLGERVVVDDTFFTRDLVSAFNRMRRYWLLALSEQSTRLFLAAREDLDEITAGGFPMRQSGPGADEALPGGVGINTSSYRDDRRRQFFRSVDRALGAVMAEDPLPVALAGIERHQSFFHEVSSPGRDVVAKVFGNYDHLTPHDLGRLVWPPVREAFTARRHEVLDELGAAVGQNRSASALEEVWSQASIGRGAVLIVEDTYHQPARVNEMGRLDLRVEDATAPDVLDDAVDEVVEMVLSKGGRVVFVEDGELANHGRIALILRY
jgi:hypothetical protein